ncbi:MAG TPA: hypothetical protein VGN17_03555 [Bryobacteraceae bacterium]|jgi:hypothetical protein
MQFDPNDSELGRRLDQLAGQASSASVSPELQKKLQDALGPSLVPVNPIPSRTNLSLLFLVVFVIGAGGLAALMKRTGLHLMSRVQIGAMASILAACGTVLAAELAGEMIPGGRRMAPLWAKWAVCGISGFLGLAVLFPWQSSGNFVAEGWPCALMEVTFALPAAGFFWLLARQGALLMSPAVGATLAGVAVVLALIPLQSQCMFQQAPHLLVWHGTAALLLIGLGAAAGNLRRVRE